MQELVELFKRLIHFALQFLKPEFIEGILISWGWMGYPMLFAIVFAETGLLIGFCLPGDSLLFIAGFVASNKILNIFYLNILLCIAAISGDAVGYQLGKKIGPRIFNREDSLLFHKSHLLRTQAFYAKHGGKTIILARFMPIVRTFAPFVAGMANMTYRQFAIYNIFGGIGWVVSMTGAGYLFGNIPWVKQNFEKVIILIILLSIAPLLIEYIRSRKSSPQSDAPP